MENARIDEAELLRKSQDKDLGRGTNDAKGMDSRTEIGPPDGLSEQKLFKAKGTDRSPTRAIRRFCMQCVGGSSLEVERCHGFDCPLWSFRFGQLPETAMKKKPELFDRDHVRGMHTR